MNQSALEKTLAEDLIESKYENVTWRPESAPGSKSIETNLQLAARPSSHRYVASMRRTLSYAESSKVSFQGQFCIENASRSTFLCAVCCDSTTEDSHSYSLGPRRGGFPARLHGFLNKKQKCQNAHFLVQGLLNFP